tara:strand:+ start:511 stop:807 length:297 start_codon:yes stop_codon:yes gene_type:complete
MSAHVMIGKEVRLHTRPCGTAEHDSQDIKASYLLALQVDGPAFAYRNGWHEPDHRIELEQILSDVLGIRSSHMRYLGIYHGDAGHLILTDEVKDFLAK